MCALALSLNPKLFNPKLYIPKTGVKEVASSRRMHAGARRVCCTYASLGLTRSINARRQLRVWQEGLVAACKHVRKHKHLLGGLSAHKSSSARPAGGRAQQHAQAPPQEFRPLTPLHRLPGF